MSLFDGFTLSHPSADNLQTGFSFPQSLTEKYRPRTFEEFAGMEKQKRILKNFASKPYPTAFLFVGAPGTGKTCAGIALAQAIPAEVHHIPSQECNVSNIERKMYAGVDAPNFARIVKESNNNVRESLQRLETELLAV